MTPSRPAFRRLAVVGLVFAGTFATAAWSLGGFARADADNSFRATSAAEASQVEVLSSAVPLSTDTTVGGPTSQTLLDSLGTSQAYAASPDPGRTGATAPALVCSLSGLPIPAPACNYPAFAATDRGQPAQTAGVPGNEVSARSADTSALASTATGVAPGPQVHTVSTSSILPNGTVKTSALITASSIVITGQLSVEGLHVMAQATLAPDGKLTTKQDLSASAIDIAGQQVALSNGSFTVPGNTQVPIPTATVLALLEGAGVTAQFQQPMETKTGVVSGSLSLSYAIPATPATPVSHVTVTLGRASADINASPANVNLGGPPPAGTGAGPPSQSGGAGQTALPPPPFGNAGRPVPASVGSPASSISGTSAPALAAPVGVTAPPALTSPRYGAAPTSPLAFARRPWTYKLGNIYLALVAAALFTFGTMTGIRLLGVRI
jgi:hypothetical protein